MEHEGSYEAESQSSAWLWLCPWLGSVQLGSLQSSAWLWLWPCPWLASVHSGSLQSLAWLCPWPCSWGQEESRGEPATLCFLVVHHSISVKIIYNMTFDELRTCTIASRGWTDWRVLCLSLAQAEALRARHGLHANVRRAHDLRAWRGWPEETDASWHLGKINQMEFIMNDNEWFAKACQFKTTTLRVCWLFLLPKRLSKHCIQSYFAVARLKDSCLQARCWCITKLITSLCERGDVIHKPLQALHIRAFSLMAFTTALVASSCSCEASHNRWVQKNLDRAPK